MTMPQYLHLYSYHLCAQDLTLTLKSVIQLGRFPRMKRMNILDVSRQNKILNILKAGKMIWWDARTGQFQRKGGKSRGGVRKGGKSRGGVRKGGKNAQQNTPGCRDIFLQKKVTQFTKFRQSVPWVSSSNKEDTEKQRKGGSTPANKISTTRVWRLV